ncbi:hypothetical protein [Vulcanisaeta sp. JCM 14467]|uniref:hypothetical protein n=1 Tax=Vulcanisaeta sp. JCM 14467 TaxID=1295370 RepID=UPI0006D2C48B|nr:hypothetical protein [Vulcanisaeta sp. JCM 14467]
MSQNILIKIGKYLIDSLQIYFSASLELQEELIKNGFYVPRSPDRKIKMPIPIIYSNFRGWLKTPEPITIERLIPPEELGLKPDDLGWTRTVKDGKTAYLIPPEKAYVEVYVKNNTISFDLNILGYHLERASIRGINPEKWTNWLMFYIDLKYIDEIIDALKNYVNINSQSQLNLPEPEKEIQQGGKEVTYYVKVPVRDFSVCMGCFDPVQKYLRKKAEEHCKLYPNLKLCENPIDIINKLRLRLEYDPSTETFAKVGIAKISGKRPQIMVKLASMGPSITIRGVAKSEIKGKARGKLVYCGHKNRRQYIDLDLISFYKALLSTRDYVDKLPKE